LTTKRRDKGLEKSWACGKERIQNSKGDAMIVQLEMGHDSKTAYWGTWKSVHKAGARQ